MASVMRGVTAVALVTGCAVLFAVGCGSSNKKKAGPGEDSAGAAGSPEGTPRGGAPGSSGGGAPGVPEGGSPEGGAAGASLEGGAAGAAVVPGEAAGSAGQAEAGTGGAAGAVASSAAGAAGSGDTAGASGAGAPACLPTGSVTDLSVGLDGFLKVCRGARAVANFIATAPDPSFTCCGVANVPWHDTVISYDVTLQGLSNGDAGGGVQFVVPEVTPLGEQTITLTCAPGPSNTFGIEVMPTLPPVVTGADSSVFELDPVHITGTNLLGVTEVTAVPVDGNWSMTSCYVNGQNTDTSVTCNFDGVNPGRYYLYVGERDCGYALNAPILEVKINP